MTDTPEGIAQEVIRRFDKKFSRQWLIEPFADSEDAAFANLLEREIAAALSRVRQKATEEAAKICDGKEARQIGQAQKYDDEGDDEGANGCWHAASMLGEAAAAIRALDQPKQGEPA